VGNFGRLLVGTAVSVGCLYIATRGTDWAQVMSTLQAADPFWVVALASISFLSHVVRAQRWRVLLRPVGQVPLGPALSATLIGFGATSVLPLRLGEIVRPALLGRRMGCGLGPPLASVVVERLFDMLFVITMLMVLSFVTEVPNQMRVGATVAGAVAVGGLTALVLMQWYRATADRLIDAALGLLPQAVAGRLRPIIEGLLRGVGALADGRTVLLVLAYSMLLWAIITATWGAALLALRIDAPLLAGSLTAVVVVAAAVFLPQGPGFVGTWQLACVLALERFGVPKDAAIGYSLLTWVVQMIVNVGSGGICLAREDVSLRELIGRAPAPESDAA
jgi:glycosyltransferase 2 family protein